MQGLSKFYSSLYASFLRHIPYYSPTLRAIVIASPGWVRDAVFDFIMAEASRTSNKGLLAARNKFIKVHITSPHVHSLVEVLKSPEVSYKSMFGGTGLNSYQIIAQLKETKFAREGIMLDKCVHNLFSVGNVSYYSLGSTKCLLLMS